MHDLVYESGQHQRQGKTELMLQFVSYCVQQLRGLVTTAADPIVVLLGAPIDTSSIAESGFTGAKGRSAFFIGLSSGMTVRFRGTVLGNLIVWSSASRED